MFKGTRTWIEQFRNKVADIPLARNWVVALTWRVIREMLRDDATHLAAGVSYFAIFSLFPTFLGVLAITGLVLNSEETKREFLLFITDNLPGSEDFIAAILPVVEYNVETLVAVSGPLGVISIIGLLWSSTGVFAAITRAVDRAWDIPYNRPFFVAKARQLVMVFALGVPFILSSAAASLASSVHIFAVQHLGTLGSWLSSLSGIITLLVIQWGLTLLMCLFIYRFVPNTKTFWRHVWLGAVVATVMFELGKELFILYLERFARFDTVYGPLSSVMVFLLWIYLSSLILVLGAEVSSEYHRMKQA